MRNPCKTGAAVVVLLAVTGCRGVLGLGDYEFGDAGGAGASIGAGGTAGVGGGGGSDVGGAGGAGASSGNGGTAGAGGAEGGASGMGGAGGASGGCGSCGALEQCFNNQVCVAKLVPVTGGYSIDATEVTRGQYAAILGSLWSMQQPAECSWNTDFTPDTGHSAYGCSSWIWPPGALGSHPVVCVDWCDAFAYCKAVGKRLCGRIGGGENLYGDYQDATKSQWFNACSCGGSNDYPYGDTYSKTSCNGSDANNGGTVGVGTMSACVSQGVYDLGGNVWEWEDSCDGEMGKNDRCRIRGGGFYYASSLRCDDADGYPRANQLDYIGFRCCAP